MDITKFSAFYHVSALLPADAEKIYEALKDNTIFYHYHPPIVTVESILEDMLALPPKKCYEDKHYIGFFHNSDLVAIMDMIENYPREGTAMIGFFSMNHAYQGKGIGTAIISDCISYWMQMGFNTVRLGIDEGNPQSKAFWTKNGFKLTGEIFPNDHSSYLILERKLR